MDIYEIMKKRRSVRSYKSEPVEEEKLKRILEAVLSAPSAANRQPIYFLIIKNEKIKYQFKNAYNAPWFYT
ncbi:MAG: nitroreductase, partial [Candidatus Brocadia sp.]